MPRQNFADDRPVIIIWEVTQRCMLACRHCRAEARPQADPDELTPAECEDLLDQVAAIAPRFFILTGGDPASRPDILNLIRGATARGLRVAFSPSATPRLLHMNFDDLRIAGVRQMSLSLDGATAETHNAFRGIPGTWDWTMQAFTSAKRARIPVQINTTFTRTNFREWDQFVDLIQRLEPVQWSVFLFVPTGRGQVEEMLSPEQTETLLKRLVDIPAKIGVPVKTTEAPHFRRVSIQSRPCFEITERPWRHAPTNDGRGCLFISHRGDIQPSGFLPVVCGNIRTDDLLDVYQKSPVFRDLRIPGLLKGKCGYCEYRRLCGGSRARAYALTGDWLAQEPTCLYQPNRAAPEVAVLTS